MNKQRSRGLQASAGASGVEATSGGPVRRSPAAAITAGETTNIGPLLWRLSAALYGLMIVWSGLQPNDSVAVFQGDALPQVFGWLLVGALTGLAALLTGRTRWLPLWSLGIGLLALVWLIAVTVAAGNGTSPRTAWHGFWQVAGLASCYFSGRAVLAGQGPRATAVALCLLGFYGSTVVGVYQMLIDFPALRAAYASNPEVVLQSVGLEAAPGSVLRQQFENRLSSPEPHGAFALANSLAVVLSSGLILLAGMLVHGWRVTDRLRRGIILLGLQAMGGIWFLTLSRTAYLAVAAGMVVWGWGVWQRSSDRRLAARWLAIGGGVLAALATLGVAWLSLNDRLVLSEAPKSVAYRIEYWRATWEMLLHYGWTGIGLGNFQEYYPRYMLATASETIADPHNWLLDVAITLSVPIAVVLVGWLVMNCTGRLSWRRGGEMPPTSPFRDPVETPDSAALAWGGGLGFGICLAMLVLVAGYRLDSYAAGWAVAAILVWFQYPSLSFVLDGQLPVVRAAVVTVLVCLLASGSWQATGIAVPWLVLMLAMQSPPSGAVRSAGSALSASRGRWSGAWWAAVLPIAGLLIFVWQSWLPVTRCWALIELAGRAGSQREQMSLVREACAADPWDAEPQRMLVGLLLAEATAADDTLFERDARRAIEQLQKWLGVESVGYLNWSFAGDRCLELAARAQQLDLDSQSFLQLSGDFYRGAVDRFPTSVRQRVQLAAVLELLAEFELAEAEIATAESLSEQTPHADRTLASQQIWLPINVDWAEVGPPAGEGFSVPAEPVAAWIRKPNDGR